MNKCILFLCIFLATALYAGEYLVLVDDLNEAKNDYFIVDFFHNHYFVLATDDDLARMSSRNFSYQILDNDPQSKDYYFVYPIFESQETVLNKYDKNIFEKYGQVLRIFDKCALMQANISRLQSITEYTFELSHLTMDQVSFETEIDPEYLAFHKKPVVRNEYIEDMIKRFEAESKDSADKILRECIKFKNRFAKYKYMRDEVNPWLKKLFLAYGCDSIIELKISGQAPLISGVRFGKKNKGLLNGYVCVMGGHTDNIIRPYNEETRHEGAWDGGSQTVSYMEACRLMQHYNFENTVVWSPFTGEEIGYKGAKALLNAFKSAGVKTICGWNFDMTGWNGRQNLRAGTAPGSKEQAAKVKELYKKYKLDKYIKMSHEVSREWEVRGTDLQEFNRTGYCATQLMGGAPGCKIHTATDVLNDQYDPQGMANACIIGTVSLMDYAVPIEKATKIASNSVSYTNNHNFSVQNLNNLISVQYSSDDQIPLSITVYNPTGKAVATLAPEKVAQNSYTANWECQTFAEGTYILMCKTNKGTLTEKVMLLK